MKDICKYCKEVVVDLTNEGLKCSKCDNYVHLSCLKRGSTPGALDGDVFFTFICLECSDNDAEVFSRDSQRWFYVLVLAFYQLNKQNKALSRNGFHHFKLHVGSFINKNWELLFGRYLKQRKNWMGTISGILSVNSSTFFTKGTFREAGWWSLTYPKLTPNVIAKLDTELRAYKATCRSQNINVSENEILGNILRTKKYPEEHLIAIDEHVSYLDSSNVADNFVGPQITIERKWVKQERSLLPTVESISTSDLDSNGTPPRKKQRFEATACEETPSSSNQESPSSSKSDKEDESWTTTLLDPMCHYNTSLRNIFMLKGMNLKTKLIGGLRDEPILSPYSNLYLKPYIHRDTKNMSQWLKIMTQIQLKVNENVDDYVLPARGPIDYVYVQPSHIPAINSLCNQFFWPGIDLTESLQYPDFSCVVMYRKLLIGFAFIVPDVKIHENYISFLFVRPGWRNIGIAKFMMYHLIQTSMGKDLTLHVAVNNPGLLLYQKFGFKVEHVELNFYDKYLRNDSFESKHAFFCRLER